ncbi:hypothetical protein [Gorillibacterium sp. CAU 1737]|uniref:hypothetical protein n=1 Tax=Gorillibacterium sp. CAU 1737 TaxID=3140362 RepID=UPI0032605B97
MKFARSERGYTMLLVLGFVMLLALLILPLAVSLNTGFLQTKTDGHTEAAFLEAESGAVVYKRIFEEAARVEEARKSYLNSDDARTLAEEVNRAVLFPTLFVRPEQDASGALASVEFAATSGEGNQKRGQVIALGFEQVTSTTTETVTSTDGDVFYNKHGVVINNPRYNYIFTPPNQAKPSSESQCTPYICNAYTGNYAKEFHEYADPFLAERNPLRQNERMAHWPGTALLSPLPPLAIPSEVEAIPSVKTKPVHAYNGTAGLAWEGDVTLVARDASIGTLANGLSFDVAGTLTLPEWSTTKLLGGARIGGDFVAGGSGSGDLIIEGSVLVKGNLAFTNNYRTIHIKGDLIVNGTVQIGQAASLIVDGAFLSGEGMVFSKPISELSVGGALSSQKAMTFADLGRVSVGGDLLAGTDMVYTTTVTDGLDVSGAISAGRNLSFASIPRISAGKWTTSWSGEMGDYLKGVPESGNRQPIIAGNTFSFNSTVNAFRATGDFSSRIFRNGANQLKNVRLGGSWLAGSDVNFNNTVDDWQIDGDLILDGTLHIQTTPKLVVKGSIYAKQGFSVENAVTQQFTVGGSVLTLGEVRFANTIQRVEIAGDILALTGIRFGNAIVKLQVGGTMATDGPLVVANSVTEWSSGGSVLAKGAITFRQNVDSLSIGGSLVTAGDLAFGNHIGSTGVRIAGDMLTGGDLSFTEIRGLAVTGMAAALKNASISNNIRDNTTFGGFYAGGTFNMANWYGQDYSGGSGFFHIHHTPKTTETTKTVTIIHTRTNTKWSTRMVQARP